MFAYVGSRTTRERHARGPGISVFRVDPGSAALQPVQVLDGLVNPSFLALNAPGDRLYSVHGDTTSISAFRVDPATGRLAHLNTQDTGGRNPVHLAIAPDGRHVVVSNHIGASLAVLPLADDGALLPLCQLLPLQGQPGPHRIEQPHAKPHFNPFTPDGGCVIVPDKGLDCVFSFRFEQGRLVPAGMPRVTARENAGPRHIAFHPHAPYAYCINELDSSVVTYRYDAATGGLRALQVLPSLPEDYPGNSRAAAIQVDGRGRYVYASNRGHDSIAVFRIDAATGLLRWQGAYAAGGRTPRHIVLSPHVAHLYVLNEDSDSIVAFRVGEDDGGLTPAGQRVQTGSPVCMVFSPG